MPLKIEFEKKGWDTTLRLNGKIIDECYAFCLTGKADGKPVLLTIEQWRFEDKKGEYGSKLHNVYKDKTVFEIEDGELTGKATLKKIIKGKKMPDKRA